MNDNVCKINFVIKNPIACRTKRKVLARDAPRLDETSRYILFFFRHFDKTFEKNIILANIIH